MHLIRLDKKNGRMSRQNRARSTRTCRRLMHRLRNERHNHLLKRFPTRRTAWLRNNQLHQSVSPQCPAVYLRPLKVGNPRISTCPLHQIHLHQPQHPRLVSRTPHPIWAKLSQRIRQFPHQIPQIHLSTRARSIIDPVPALLPLHPRTPKGYLRCHAQHHNQLQFQSLHQFPLQPLDLARLLGKMLMINPLPRPKNMPAGLYQL